MQGWKDGCQNRLRERAHHRWASIRTAGGRTVEACMKLQSPLDLGIRHKHVRSASRWSLVSRSGSAVSQNPHSDRDAGHESRRLARELLHNEGWKLVIVRRRERAFKITGLTWIVERSFAWLGRNRRLSKDYEYRVQTSELMIDLAATRLMLNRLAR